jgi:hypothetical protein
MATRNAGGLGDDAMSSAEVMSPKGHEGTFVLS